MHTTCVFCGATVVLVQVHGHYQCPACKTNALPCCDGDNCDNFLLPAEQDNRESREQFIDLPPGNNKAERHGT